MARRPIWSFPRTWTQSRPYIPFREDEEFLYGRGVCDAKGIIASQVAAAEELRAAGFRIRPVVRLWRRARLRRGQSRQRKSQSLPFPHQRRAYRQPPRARFDRALCASFSAPPASWPTPHIPNSATPLFTSLSMPSRSILALELPVTEDIGPSTLNIGQIRGGYAPNVISDHAEALILARLVGPSEPIRDAIPRSSARPRRSDFALRHSLRAPPRRAGPAHHVTPSSPPTFPGSRTGASRCCSAPAPSTLLSLPPSASRKKRFSTPWSCTFRWRSYCYPDRSAKMLKREPHACIHLRHSPQHSCRSACITRRVQGKVVLIVNVASKCGLTPQYEGLEMLYTDYKDKGFVIAGLSSNDFAGQEPGTNEEIQSFCTMNFGVDFPSSRRFPSLARRSIRSTPRLLRRSLQPSAPPRSH